MRTDPSLPGFLIQDTNSEGLITLCQSQGNLLTTANKFATGCILIDTTNGKNYYNSGTSASPSWNSISEASGSEITLSDNILKTATLTIAAADITSTSAGKLGHANGMVLVADPGTGKLVELISAILSFTYATAAYTDGGNITINSNGGSALTGLVSAANSFGASADKLVQFVPLAATGNALTVNKGLNIVSSAAFTNPGTAAGTAKVFTTYRIITL